MSEDILSVYAVFYNCGYRFGRVDQSRYEPVTCVQPTFAFPEMKKKTESNS